MNPVVPTTLVAVPRPSAHLPPGGSSAAERRAWAQNKCRAAHVRLTPIRERILAALAELRVPASLETIAHAEVVRGQCDAATIYRGMMLFKEIGVIRQVTLTSRLSYFVLNLPGQSTQFLICRRCGVVTDLPEGDEFSQAQREIAQRSGYTQLEHEIIFFGFCPTCQFLPPRIPWTKVPVR